MSDPDAVKRLTNEAFQRSQKDIHAAHIFIAFMKDGVRDTAGARTKLAIVQSRLAKGEDFGRIAQDLSDDPSAKINQGDLNYITVFTLPYEFENILYTTAPGKYSKPYTSGAGYHIFRNIAERKSVGKLKLQQILLAFPPNADENDKALVAKKADSIYQRILKGDEFGRLANTFSNDYVSAASNGNMPDVSVGQYDPVFEKAVWAIPADDAVTKPFMTAHGYHIVKRIGAKPTITEVTDQANFEALQQRVMLDDRWKTAKDFIYARVKEKAGYKNLYPSEKALWGITDSLVDLQHPGAGAAMKRTSPVLRIGDTTFLVSDWTAYVLQNRYKSDRVSMKDFPTLWSEFSKQSMYQYYRTHLEDYNDDFRYQMTEFRDGNLFFEIMQQEVWNKAQEDSVALMKMYQQNKAKYDWKKSADAILFFCSDTATATSLYATLKEKPASWRKEVEGLNEKVVADSSRFEWEQLPGFVSAAPVAKSFTPLVTNPNDNTASFAWVSAVYTTPTPRTYVEAKGLVMNDYQTMLEDKWTKQLKKKYPVVVDQKVLAQISK